MSERDHSTSSHSLRLLEALLQRAKLVSERYTVIIDTSVWTNLLLFNSVLGPKTPYPELFELLEAKTLRVLSSPRLEAEFLYVLHSLAKRYELDERVVASFLTVRKSLITMINERAAPEVNASALKFADTEIVSMAMIARPDLIISEDQDILELGEFLAGYGSKGILMPAALVKLLSRKEDVRAVDGPSADRISLDVATISKDTSVPVIILTALQLEGEAVLEFLTEQEFVLHPSGATNFFVAANPTGLGPIAVLWCGKGNEQAAVLTERMMSYFKPRYAFFVGVGGGLKDVKLGDVVIADLVHNYEYAKIDQGYMSRPQSRRPDSRILAVAEREVYERSWLSMISPKIGVEPEPKALLGPIVAGSKVIADKTSEDYDRLQQQFNDALAVDMESSGFLTAAFLNPDVQSLTIRGISDLISDKAKSDRGGSQTRAAHNAAAFTMALLKRLE